MRKFLKKLLGPLLERLASSASSPVKKNVFASLTKLLHHIKTKPGKRGLLLEVDFSKEKFIIFSDHHKGNKDYGDDFASNEPNYLAALDFYHQQNYSYINLGDAEEMWKYSPQQVMEKNAAPFLAEARFHDACKYFKTFGNHDLIWKNKLDVDIWFKDIFKLPLPVWEGILLQTKIGEKTLSFFLTHGHQGDKMSDNNGLSTWLVSHLWRPLQRYLRINVNTPATDYALRGKHNILMYEWSSRRENLLLITGHTHKPVFASGLYSDHPSNLIPGSNIIPQQKTKHIIPSYFNSGCCCYNDGDITGIEIGDNKISLVKWHWENNVSKRTVLEEKLLEELFDDLVK
ncbi:MAG: metallophosphoesterase [Ferruginibacter sp.]